MATASIKAVTRFFLDRTEITRKVDAGKRRALSKFGAFVRRSARSSIRTRKTTSKPGHPPTNRTGHLRRLIFFSLEPESGNVVIGPVIFSGARRQRPMAQELLEYGGSVPGNNREVWLTNEPGRDVLGRFVSHGRRRVVFTGRMTYDPRPFMRPAFAKNLTNPKLTDVLKDVIR